LSQCSLIDRGETQCTNKEYEKHNKQNRFFDHLTSPYKIDANAAAPFHADRIKYIHAQPVRPSSAATVQALQNNTAKTALRNNINILFFLTVQFFQFHENQHQYSKDTQIDPPEEQAENHQNDPQIGETGF
jgi:hypothetical protein